MRLHHLGAMLMALQACGGVAAASVVLGRDDSKAAGPLPGDPKIKLAKPNDGGGPTTLVAYADGVCQKPLDKTAPDGGGPIQSTFEIKDSWPNVTTFKAQNWNPAEKASGKPDSTPQGGWNVFFSVKDPEPSCRVIVMVPYPKGVRPPTDGAKGIQIINTAAAGCLFASINDYQDLMMSTCCGEKCDAFATLQGDTALLPPNYGSKSQVPRSLPAPREPGTTANLAARAGSLARRFLYNAPAVAPCVHTKSKDTVPYAQAGNQTIVQTFQNCQTVPCQFNNMKSTTASQTLKVDHTDTLSNEFHLNVGAEGKLGIPGLAEAGWKTEIGWSINKAVANAYGKDTTNSTTVQFGQVESVVSGQYVAMTYTPMYTCYTGLFDCHMDPVPSSGTHCIPDDGGQTVGNSSGNLVALVHG